MVILVNRSTDQGGQSPPRHSDSSWSIDGVKSWSKLFVHFWGRNTLQTKPPSSICGDIVWRRAVTHPHPDAWRTMSLSPAYWKEGRSGSMHMDPWRIQSTHRRATPSGFAGALTLPPSLPLSSPSTHASSISLLSVSPLAAADILRCPFPTFPSHLFHPISSFPRGVLPSFPHLRSFHPLFFSPLLPSFHPHLPPSSPIPFHPHLLPRSSLPSLPSLPPSLPHPFPVLLLQAAPDDAGYGRASGAASGAASCAASCAADVACGSGDGDGSASCGDEDDGAAVRRSRGNRVILPQGRASRAPLIWLAARATAARATKASYGDDGAAGRASRAADVATGDGSASYGDDGPDVECGAARRSRGNRGDTSPGPGFTRG
ncbi:hypothetical protein C8R47DRAFT_1317213 [Mycena vitilis]|nr:hypothetical protein C8R47DRAFT_1317213 [Mycena vitilis]